MFFYCGRRFFARIRFVSAQMLHAFGAPHNYPLQRALQEFYIMPVGAVDD